MQVYSLEYNIRDFRIIDLCLVLLRNIESRDALYDGPHTLIYVYVYVRLLSLMHRHHQLTAWNIPKYSAT